MERVEPTVATPEGGSQNAPAPDELHDKLRAIVERLDDGAQREEHAKGLLDQLAKRHGDADVELLDWFAHKAEVEQPLRNHAVSLLLGLGYPHALRVSPEALAAYRATRPIPVISLIVLALYAFAEFLLITQAQRTGPDIWATAFIAHLATWVASVLGLLFVEPRSGLSVACRVVLWVAWLVPIVGAGAFFWTLAERQTTWGLILLCAGAVLFGPGIAAIYRVTRKANFGG